MTVMDKIFIIISGIAIVLSAISLVRTLLKKPHISISRLIENNDMIKAKLIDADTPQESASASWELIEHGTMSTPTISNARKTKYSDKRESRRFCSSLSKERTDKLDKLDKNYGQYRVC